MSATNRQSTTEDRAAGGAGRLAGQTVVVIGGSAGIGLETAMAGREQGADLITTARNEDRLRSVGEQLRARVEAFDATDFDHRRREQLRSQSMRQACQIFPCRGWRPGLGLVSPLARPTGKNKRLGTKRATDGGQSNEQH